MADTAVEVEADGQAVRVTSADRVIFPPSITKLQVVEYYVAVGPVFRTISKEKPDAVVGLDLVRQAATAAGGRPVVGIGGITLDRAPAVIAAGATAVAVIGDLLVGDPEARVAMFVERLENARRTRSASA